MGFRQKAEVGQFECSDEGFQVVLQVACETVVERLMRYLPGDPYDRGIDYGEIFQSAFLIALGNPVVTQSEAVQAFLTAWKRAREGFFGRRVLQGYRDYYVWKYRVVHGRGDEDRILIIVPEPPSGSVHRFVVLHKPTAWRREMGELLQPVKELEFSSEE